MDNTIKAQPFRQQMANTAGPPTTLTSGGIKAIYDMPVGTKSRAQNFYFQVISAKMFPAPEGGANSNPKQEEAKIRAKFVLSDGVSSARALVQEGSFKKLTAVPENFNVIKLTNFVRIAIQEQMLIVLKEPIEIIYESLDSRLGQPEDITKLINSGFSNFNVEIPVFPPTPQPIKQQIQRPQTTTTTNQQQVKQPLEKETPACSLPQTITKHYEQSESQFMQQRKNQIHKQALTIIT